MMKIYLRMKLQISLKSLSMRTGVQYIIVTSWTDATPCHAMPCHVRFHINKFDKN